MRCHKAPESNPFDDRSSETATQGMAALVRLITYARDEAKRLDFDVLAFCLDAAVAAAREEYDKQTSGPKHVADATVVSQKRAASEPVH